MFAGPFDYSIIKRAAEKKFVDIHIVNIRDFGVGKHKVVDDTPYGGGLGMVMRVDVLHKAIISVKDKKLKSDEKAVLLSARGEQFKQEKAISFATLSHLILICGHYEGVDERIMKYIDQEISVGDFVTTGGEIPAMAITDAVTRLLTGVLKEGVTGHESFSLSSTENSSKLLEYPHYTNPPQYDEQAVPDILLSGNHKKIMEWRLTKAKEKTKQVRPDLL